jgi:hypothetical protein
MDTIRSCRKEASGARGSSPVTSSFQDKETKAKRCLIKDHSFKARRRGGANVLSPM